MANFEVFIPPAVAGMPGMTLRVAADNWMFALQAGRQKLGEQGNLGSNILCDFKEDGSVHVTDPATGRVFRILELHDVPAPAPAPAPAAPPPPPPPVVAAPAAPPPPPPVVAAPPPPVAPAPAAPPPRPMVKPIPMEQKVAPKVAPTPVAAPMPAPAQGSVQVAATPAAAPSGPIGRQEKSGNIEEALADIFQSVMDLWATCKTKEDVAGFMLDLALKQIGADAGAIVFGDIGGDALTFLAARGPKAKDAMKFKIPLGQGIVGFCVASGVSVAISDAHKDPRWYGAISKGTGYDTKSILCSVIQYDGQSLGALELINKKNGTPFSVDEINILNYVAHETGDALARILDQEFAAKNKR